MNGLICVENYAPPKINESEVLRYAGVKGQAKEVERILKECILEAEKSLIYKVCFLEIPVTITDENVDLGFAKIKSKDLSKNLKGCNKAVLFCASVGIGIDRLIAKHSVISPTKALIFQALGTERIESLCDLFNERITSTYKNTKPRFSPGYGDFSIEVQREIFSVLNCSKQIGVHLNQSLLMSPSKSVTAIIGVSEIKTTVKKKSCCNCEKTDCEFRE